MTDEQRKEAERLAGEYFHINEFDSGLRLKGIYTDKIILGWVKSTYLVAYAAACEAKTKEVNHANRRLADIVEMLNFEINRGKMLANAISRAFELLDKDFNKARRKAKDLLNEALNNFVAGK